MSQFYLFILGRTPSLSKSEIFSVLKREDISYTQQYENEELIIIKAEEFDVIHIQNQLGGTIKIGQGDFYADIEKELFPNLLNKKEGKIVFGVSGYKGDRSVSSNQIKQLGRDIKKQLKNDGFSCKYIEAKDAALSSAQVSQNGLIPKGAEFLIVYFHDNYFIGKTLSIQSIRQFQTRDVEKPRRSMEVGMLPPKLARMMINISGLDKAKKLLDPFCGMGTVLLEAISLGYTNIHGSDIESNQVQATQENLLWAKQKYHWQGEFSVKEVDVRKLKKEFSSIDAIITEPYLGEILSGKETEQAISKNINYLNALYTDAFKSFENVLTKKGKLVIIIPELHLRKKVYKLDLKQFLKQTSFVEIESHLYKRPGQFVARHIYIFEKQ